MFTLITHNISLDITTIKLIEYLNAWKIVSLEWVRLKQHQTDLKAFNAWISDTKISYIRHGQRFSTLGKGSWLIIGGSRLRRQGVLPIFSTTGGVGAEPPWPCPVINHKNSNRNALVFHIDGEGVWPHRVIQVDLKCIATNVDHD